MIIQIRTNTAEKWKKVQNKSKGKCDFCNMPLWVSPGNQKYCNNPRDNHDVNN